MKWRHVLALADISVVVVLALVDRWPTDNWATALVTAAGVLVAPLLWAYDDAPAPAWGWTISGLLLALLLACLGLSRVVLSHGPAAPPIDWLLPYVLVGVAVYLVAMRLSRSWRWDTVGPLTALLAVSLGWGLLQWVLIENTVTIPVGDAAPRTSGLTIVDVGQSSCGNDGGLCDREVIVRTDRSPAEVRSLLRSHGWSTDCRPVTGILTAVAHFEYGSRCVSVEAGREPGVVVVGLLGKADWWLKLEQELENGP